MTSRTHNQSSLPDLGGWLGVVLVMIAAWLGLARATSAEAISEREYELKAAFLFNFTKFVDWPAISFGDNQSPIVLGVLRHDFFHRTLENTVADRKVNERGLSVKAVESTRDVRGIHVLFVPAGKEDILLDLADTLREAAVLTVGESDSFSRAGGIITFVTERDKVRFEINATAAQQAGLKLSAQLLKLASKVRD